MENASSTSIFGGDGVIAEQGSGETADGFKWMLSDGGTGVCITRYHGKMTEVVVPSEIEGKPVVEIGKSVFVLNKDITGVVIPAGVTSIGSWAFQGCENLTNVVVPEGVRSIGKNAFQDCYNLTDIVIPSTVKTIGEHAFAHCHELEELAIPSQVEVICCKVFFDCKSLEEVTIPSSVTDVQADAFDGCHSLRDIYYGGTEEQWGSLNIQAHRVNTAIIHYQHGA